MNCLISDQPYLRAIESLLADLSAPCETLILTSELSATDLAYSVLHSAAAAKVGEVTVISHRELGTDPAVDLLDRSLYRQAWVRCLSDAGHPVPFAGNVILVHSQGEVRAAIGSAPLVDGRWGVEHDVWTVLRTRCGCAPIAMHELADLLHTISSGGASLPDLDRQFELDPHSAFALHSLASEIRSLEAVDTDARLLTNLQRTMAEQLRENASEPVQDLAVYAPAYHPELHGIDTLINAFRPTGTATIYTNGQQRFDREHLTQRACADGTRRSVHVDFSSSLRAHAAPHATVIQWRTQDGGVYALTGLASICDKTLEQTMSADAAALQIAVLSQTDTTLLPCPEMAGAASQMRVLPLPLGSVPTPNVR